MLGLFAGTDYKSKLIGLASFGAKFAYDYFMNGGDLDKTSFAYIWLILFVLMFFTWELVKIVSDHKGSLMGYVFVIATCYCMISFCNTRENKCTEGFYYAANQTNKFSFY